MFLFFWCRYKQLVNYPQDIIQIMDLVVHQEVVDRPRTAHRTLIPHPFPTLTTTLSRQFQRMLQESGDVAETDRRIQALHAVSRATVHSPALAPLGAHVQPNRTPQNEGLGPHRHRPLGGSMPGLSRDMMQGIRVLCVTSVTVIAGGYPRHGCALQ